MSGVGAPFCCPVRCDRAKTANDWWDAGKVVDVSYDITANFPDIPPPAVGMETRSASGSFTLDNLGGSFPGYPCSINALWSYAGSTINHHWQYPIASDPPTTVTIDININSCYLRFLWREGRTQTWESSSFDLYKPIEADSLVVGSFMQVAICRSWPPAYPSCRAGGGTTSPGGIATEEFNWHACDEAFPSTFDFSKTGDIIAVDSFTGNEYFGDYTLDWTCEIVDP